MTFEELFESLDKKRVKKNSDWQWVYNQVYKCQSEYIDKQKVKDAKERLYRNLPWKGDGDFGIKLKEAFKEFEKELGLNEK